MAAASNHVDDHELEEEEEEEEEEPKLKYVRLGGHVEELLLKDTASCLVVHEKFIVRDININSYFQKDSVYFPTCISTHFKSILGLKKPQPEIFDHFFSKYPFSAQHYLFLNSIIWKTSVYVLGTHWGTVHVVDFAGSSIRQFTSHRSSVTDISVDHAGEYVATCSSDGSVTIQGLFSDEVQRFEFDRPLNSIAIEPHYSKSEKREFVCGGKDEKLVLTTKGWFGLSTKDIVLHQNMGPIYCVRWRGTLIAWANDQGVRVYDTLTKQMITYIDRPQGSVRPDLYHCSIVWENDTTLIIGWANFVKIGIVQSRPKDENPSLPARRIVIVSEFKTPYFFISGIAPFKNDLAILGYAEKSSQSATLEPPALYIMDRSGTEISSDAIPVKEYSIWRATDYHLASLIPAGWFRPTSGATQATHQASFNAVNAGSSNNSGSAGGDWLFYVVSPKDIVSAQTRDLDDHLAWLISGGHFEKALAAVKACPGQARHPAHTLANIGEKYLTYLLQNDEIDLAAQECPQILGSDKQLWQQWIPRFEQVRKLRIIAPYVPIEKPTLDNMFYEMILNDFLQHDPNGLWQTLSTWPSNLYRLGAIIAGIKEKLRSTASKQEQTLLCKALVRLYIENKQFDEALDLYSRLGEDVVEFVRKYGLQNFRNIGDQILTLILPNPERGIDLLVENTHLIRVDFVVQQFLNYMPANDPRRNDGRRLAYMYLHALSEKNNRDEGNEFYDLQLQLYADFDTEGFPNLRKFLNKSQAYNENLALKICQSKGLYQEMAFLHDRIGNTQEALSLLIDKVGDVTQAIDFVTKKSEKGENELWDELISKSINKPAFVSELLERVGAHINPLKLVEQIPLNLAIPRLQKSLVKIINDYNLQMSLQEGCKTILDNDCVLLSERLTRGLRHAVRVNRQGDCGKCSMCSMTIFDTKVKAEVVVFFCGHLYHSACLNTKSIIPEAESSNSRKLAQTSIGSGGGEAKDLVCKICRSSTEKSAAVVDKSFGKSRAQRS